MTVSKRVQWLDLFGRDLADGVQQLFALTSAAEYACSLEDFLAKGWMGEACRVPVPGGFVMVHPQRFCPSGALFAIDPTPQEDAKQLKEDLEHARQSILDENKRRMAAEKKAAELGRLLHDVLGAAVRAHEAAGDL